MRSTRRSRRQARRGDSRGVDSLLYQRPPNFRVWHLDEPELVFLDERRTVDPKTGLEAFGAIDQADRPVVRVGLIGTGGMIDKARAFLESTRSRIAPGARRTPSGALKFPDPVLFPDWPGPEDGQFQVEFAVTSEEPISAKEVELALRPTEHSGRVAATRDLLSDRLETIREMDATPDLVLLALPKALETKLAGAGGGVRPKVAHDPRLKFVRKAEREQRRSGQGLLFDIPSALGLQSIADVPPVSLHRAMKIAAMRCGIPVQLVWESTLSSDGARQDDATVAWNLCVAMYYKAGGVPWRVAGLDPNTCYVGISFFRPLGRDSTLCASVAQAFLPTGDGVVLRGEPFEWRERFGAQLPRAEARALLERVLAVFERSSRISPRRVVVHKSSNFGPEERAGLEEALGDVRSRDFVTLRRSDVFMMRLGQHPPIRGTAVELDDTSGKALLYTRGYVPFLGCYPGSRIPRPLDVTVAAGDSSLRRVCSEILALTKMNWNSADFCGAEPITLAFSRRVGRILGSMPSDGEPATTYRYYM